MHNRLSPLRWSHIAPGDPRSSCCRQSSWNASALRIRIFPPHVSSRHLTGALRHALGHGQHIKPDCGSPLPVNFYSCKKTCWRASRSRTPLVYLGTSDVHNTRHTSKSWIHDCYATIKIGHK
jgi:hypothetical protein